MESPSSGGSMPDTKEGQKRKNSDLKRIGYSCRPCFDRLQTIPVCSFELKPSFS
jgi:hypothetical protein